MYPCKSQQIKSLGVDKSVAVVADFGSSAMKTVEIQRTPSLSSFT
jgi:hypothetical protein